MFSCTVTRKQLDQSATSEKGISPLTYAKVCHLRKTRRCPKQQQQQQQQQQSLHLFCVVRMVTINETHALILSPPPYSVPPPYYLPSEWTLFLSFAILLGGAIVSQYWPPCARTFVCTEAPIKDGNTPVSRAPSTTTTADCSRVFCWLFIVQLQMRPSLPVKWIWDSVTFSPFPHHVVVTAQSGRLSLNSFLFPRRFMEH